MSSIQGLTQSEVHEHMREYGPNELETRKQTLFVFRVVKKALNPLILILLFSSLLSAALGQGIDAVIIGAILCISLFLDAYQEDRAENAAEQLAEKLHHRVRVIRDGQEQEILTRDVTIGDIICLQTGNIVPADARIVETENLSLNESILTGESFPREKSEGEEIFMGTHVLSGTCLASVVRIGEDTEIGKIHETISQEKPATDFEKGLRNFSLLLVRATIFFGLLLFIGRVWIDHQVIQSLMFVVAIAIGFAPELLPMILTINLTKGALRLSKKGVIVKFLPAIENLGSMDVLCTDKTGTLTQSEIAFEQALNLQGEVDKVVLQYATMNAALQSGYKNPLDEALLGVQKNLLEGVIKKGEVAYDFYRRRLSVIVEYQGRYLMITKGAVQSILDVCTNKEALKVDLEALGKEGLRTLGVAIKEIDPRETYSEADERDMTLVGVLTFSDPIKPDIAKVVKQLQELHVGLKIITGDNALVAKSVCEKIGLSTKYVMTGEEVDSLSAEALRERVEEVSLFAHINPGAKLKIIQALKSRGHVVGYMGDGINDAPALKAADIGISVENGVDVAKESADLILLKKDLGVLRIGIYEGRKTFANIMKYILMGTSSTFGNMVSLSIGSLWLPFLPLLPAQILLNDLLYDASQLLLVKDNVDHYLVEKPYRWDIRFIRKFMVVFGGLSSLFDIMTFYILYQVFQASSALFQTGWFLESAVSQMVIIFSIRTAVVPFFRSRSSWPFIGGILSIILLVVVIPFSPLGPLLKFVHPPKIFLIGLLAIIVLYMIMTEIAKYFFYAHVRREQHERSMLRRPRVKKGLAMIG